MNTNLHPVDAVNEWRELERRYDEIAADTVRRGTGRMRVTVRDRAAEAPWGAGPTRPVLVVVEVNATCPACGGPRGEPRRVRQHEDGVTYYVDVWSNRCGHTDRYESVLREFGVRRISRWSV